MSDNRNIIEKASDKAKELEGNVKEGVDAMVHGLHGDIDPNRVSDHGMHDLGTTFGSHKDSMKCKFVREKAGGQPELQRY